MDSYVDFTLLPDPELPATVLMSELFGHIHLALVDHGKGAVGVSFPSAGDAVGLGGVLRLHSTKAHLETVQRGLRLGALAGYLAVQGPQAIPSDVKYRVVKRVQAKSSPARLRRRLVRRHKMTMEQAVKQVPDKAKESLKLPFINLKSASTGQLFPLFIEQAAYQSEPQPGQFSTYGLSSSTTVPWF